MYSYIQFHFCDIERTNTTGKNKSKKHYPCKNICHNVVLTSDISDIFYTRSFLCSLLSNLPEIIMAL